MKNFSLNILFVSVVFFASFHLKVTAASEGSFVFICHTGLGYDRAEVIRAYRAQLDEPRPVDNKSLQDRLLHEIGYDEKRYHKSWEKGFFRRAMLPPVKKENDAAVIEYVSGNPQGIGYVSSAPKNPDVEVCGN